MKGVVRDGRCARLAGDRAAASEAAFDGTGAPPGVADAADVRRALAERELEVWFQPKIEVGSRRVAGAEALLRWRHPDRGLTGPAEILTAAAEADMMIELTRYLLADAQIFGWGGPERRTLISDLTFVPVNGATIALCWLAGRAHPSTGSADPARLVVDVRRLVVLSTGRSDPNDLRGGAAPRSALPELVRRGLPEFLPLRADRADARSLDTLLVRADMALYDARRADRDCVRIYHPG